MEDRITKNSKIYQLADSLPGMIVQTLLLLIPLHMSVDIYVDCATC